MGGCSSDPTAGCTEESLIVASINACCAQENTNSTNILNKLEEIRLANATCCDTINTNMTTIAGLLTQILSKITA